MKYMDDLVDARTLRRLNQISVFRSPIWILIAVFMFFCSVISTYGAYALISLANNNAVTNNPLVFFIVSYGLGATCMLTTFVFVALVFLSLQKHLSAKKNDNFVNRLTLRLQRKINSLNDDYKELSEFRDKTVDGDVIRELYIVIGQNRIAKSAVLEARKIVLLNMARLFREGKYSEVDSDIDNYEKTMQLI